MPRREDTDASVADVLAYSSWVPEEWEIPGQMNTGNRLDDALALHRQAFEMTFQGKMEPRPTALRKPDGRSVRRRGGVKGGSMT